MHRVAAMHLPSFHNMGIVAQLLGPLVSGSGVALFPPQSIHDHSQLPIVPTSDNVVEHSKRNGVTFMASVPSWVELWAQTGEMDWLKSMTGVVSTNLQAIQGVLANWDFRYLVAARWRRRSATSWWRRA